MSSTPPRFSHGPARGFTLVEIMIVVVIIGLLAALAIPAFQRVQRASKITRIINDYRVFTQAFEVYNSLNGAWPNNVGPGVVPTTPVPMTDDFKVTTWQAATVVGGRWNWDNSMASGGDAGIAVSGYTCDDALWADVDAKIDDGDLTTGNFVQVSSTRVRMILARP